MMISNELEAKIENLIKSLECELYGIDILKENDSKILRIYITKSPQVTLDDCKEVSLVLSPLLDVELENYDNYFLEVSSPGIERVLKTMVHFKSAIGEMVKIKTINKHEYKGKLIKVEAESLVIEDGTKIEIQDIKKAQTFFIW